jgi:hypothetical protein
MLIAGSAQAAMPEPPIVAFDRFVTESNPVCQSQGATQCVDLAWRFADADEDGGLSLDELGRLRADLEVWAIWRQAELAEVERSGIAFGLWLVDSIALNTCIPRMIRTATVWSAAASCSLTCISTNVRSASSCSIPRRSITPGSRVGSVCRQPSSSACRCIRRNSEPGRTAPTTRPAFGPAARRRTVVCDCGSGQPGSIRLISERIAGSYCSPVMFVTARRPFSSRASVKVRSLKPAHTLPPPGPPSCARSRKK